MMQHILVKCLGQDYRRLRELGKVFEYSIENLRIKSECGERIRQEML